MTYAEVLYTRCYPEQVGPEQFFRNTGTLNPLKLIEKIWVKYRMK